jgi:DNA-binding IclR family transcriptional regulator
MVQKQRTREIAVLESSTAEAVVKSAGRVLEVLSVFDDVQREMRVGEITERLGFPQSSTSVLLKSLVKLGYLDYDANTRSFSVTARVALLGSWISDGSIVDGTVLRAMEYLSSETGNTITLASRNGIFAQYIRVIQATNALRLHTPVGTRRLLVWSASGFALLRDVADSEIRALVRRTASEQPRQKLSASEVVKNVDKFRQEGYFFSRELVTPGGGHIAVRLPSRSTGRTHCLAIGVSGWIEEIQRNEAKIVKLMRRAIRSVGLDTKTESAPER